MSKKFFIALLSSTVLLGFGTLFLLKQRTFFDAVLPRAALLKVDLRQGSHSAVPKNCKNLGLLGSTPHPTKFLLRDANNIDRLSCIKLEDFLDVKELKNSFRETIELCKTFRVDHLLIAYLPVYFASLKKVFKENCGFLVERFFNAIGLQLRKLIEDVVQEEGSSLSITLIIPPRGELDRIPEEITSFQQYSQYLVKQFPKLFWDGANLKDITIINTRVDDPAQTDDIIRHLQYEYLFAPKITFKKAFLEKKSFHDYTFKRFL